jgi:hypothetical protein
VQGHEDAGEGRLGLVADDAAKLAGLIDGPNRSADDEDREERERHRGKISKELRPMSHEDFLQGRRWPLDGRMVTDRTSHINYDTESSFTVVSGASLRPLAPCSPAAPLVPGRRCVPGRPPCTLPPRSRFLNFER